MNLAAQANIWNLKIARAGIMQIITNLITK
jgi:hypothetical protein